MPKRLLLREDEQDRLFDQRGGAGVHAWQRGTQGAGLRPLPLVCGDTTENLLRKLL